MTCLSAVVPSFSSIKYDFSPLFFVRVPSFDLPCIRRWWGWQVIALHGILFVLNVQHVPKKSLNIHTQTHTNLCEQWNTNRFDASDLKCLFANCASIRLHWLTESIVILSCTRVWYVFVCGFQPSNLIIPPFWKRTHARTHTPFHFIPLAKTKIRKALPKPKIVSIEYSN